MPRILAVDDSSTIRSVVAKNLAELGVEIENAENGEEGLAKLAAGHFDLILLDVTMPVMDGPTMLQKLRASGCTTPVIMLTSESRRSTVASTIRLGIDDYILKPFKPEELRHKVKKTLRLATPAPGVSTEQAAAAAASANDVLVIDDMENVPKKLGTLVPAHVTVHGVTTAADALAKCHERAFRIIVIDLVIPGVNSVALMNQLRAMQPSAIMVALGLRGPDDRSAEAKAQGFADALVKPFDPDAIDELAAKYLGGEVVACNAEVVAVASYEGREDRVDRYYQRVRGACREAFETVASACFDDVVVDLSKVPVRADKLVRMVIELDKEAKKLGLRLRLVGSPELRRALAGIADTAEVSAFETIELAREAA